MPTCHSYFLLKLSMISSAMKLQPTYMATRAHMLVFKSSGKSISPSGLHFCPNSVASMHASFKSVYSFQTSAWNPYLKMERYWNSLRNHGMLFWFTKKPAKSMNGMMRTGVSVTASCLSEKIVPRMSA